MAAGQKKKLSKMEQFLKILFPGEWVRRDLAARFDSRFNQRSDQ
jgi:hypothetical protein